MSQQVVNSQVSRIFLRFYVGFKITETDVQKCFSKKGLFQNFCKLHRKTPVPESLF